MTTTGPRTTALTNIGTLVTNDPSLGDGPLGVRENAAVVFEDGVVAWVGDSADAPAADTGFDLGGRAVLPGFVESHSHLVFAGERAEEFAARMSGEKYAAGGIRTTIEATRAASDDQLAANARRLLDESLRSGSTTVEIKSGYGQSTRDELRSVQVAGRFTDEVTLLAAHVPPPEYAGRGDEYVTMAVDEMIPACAPYAKWIDVFCERGAFTVEQSRAVLAAGVAHGLIPRVHGNQLGEGPGVQLAVEMGAASVDHVTYVTDADIDALAGSSTVATLLPGPTSPPATSTRGPRADRRRRHRRAGCGLQSRYLLHHQPAVLHCHRCPGHAHDPGRGRVGGHRGGREGAAPRRRRQPADRRPRRRHRARRPVVPASRLPSRCAAGS